MTKFCKDCKFCNRDYQCNNPKLIKEDQYDKVTGELRLKSCHELRHRYELDFVDPPIENLCGPDAKLFEPREETNKQQIIQHNSLYTSIWNFFKRKINVDNNSDRFNQ